MMCSFEVVRTELIESVKNSFERNNTDILRKKYDTFKVNENDKRSALDQVLRDYLLQLLAEPCNNVSVWEMYVTFCIEACRQDMCTPTMPVVLLGDIFDALTLDQCEKLFAFVENGVNTWREEMFFSACKNNLLRMCNDLLRRLSRSQNTVFCGRILLFLAKFFPFSERSGLNIVSEFNLDNLTEFGGESSNDLKDILAEKDEAMEEDVKPDAKIKIDYNLYCKFWALQDFFRNPNQCYSKVHWKTFSAHASNVLLAFKSFKLDDMQCKHQKLDTSDEDRQQQQQQQHYFAKFLTNQKLLELQLSDANFRRYVLLQFLILFQYLNSPVKFKSDTHELKVDQADWVKEKTEMVYCLLEETPPDGLAFVQTVKHILKREEHWNSWKNDGCPEFQKPAHQVTADETIEEGGEKRKVLPRPRRPKKSLGEQMKDATQHGKFIMGNVELTKLWNLCPNNLEACKSRDRDFLPSLEGYFEEAIEQIEPAAMVEEEYKRVNDGNFGWRALRLLARRSPHFFTHSNNPINKLPEYLETMIKKIAKDRPSSLSSEEIKVELMDSDVQTVVPDAENEDDELLKSEEKEERTMPQEYEDDGMGAEKGDSKRSILLKEQLQAIAVKVAPQWKKLATKLGYQDDEVDFFQNEQNTDVERALNMLQIWAEDDEDASPDNLSYTLEGLGLMEAADALREVTDLMNMG
ncbi:THO complex subunit 1 [Zootermopsis nevadensis]|uniref:THO complex subunit 1 n=1 Tax=Zootermopsis nevadensis TaxID=136037 RepID=A0A067RKL8_ZOONE|nr:THO complex subunit 1 [Zootermopsis nevadensis]KDR20035.1 THO complex subunit 1 [Zootermopsis nevadensis]